MRPLVLLWAPGSCLASPQPAGFLLAALQGRVQVLQGPGQGHAVSPWPEPGSSGCAERGSAVPLWLKHRGKPEDGVPQEPHAGPYGP